MSKRRHFLKTNCYSKSSTPTIEITVYISQELYNNMYSKYIYALIIPSLSNIATHLHSNVTHSFRVISLKTKSTDK